MLLTYMKRIVYHHLDEDGWGSAAVIKQQYPDVEMVGCIHGRNVEFVSGYDEVYVVDYCFAPDEMKQLHDNNNKFIWIDHHESAIKSITEKYEGIQDTSKAGCELTWDYFHQEEEPRIIFHIGDEDIWRFSDKRSPAFMLYMNALFTEGNEIDIILQAMENYDEAAYENAYAHGKTIEQFRASQIKTQISRGTKQEFLGHKAIIFFSNINISYLGHSALDANPDVDIAVIIMFVERNGQKVYKYSMRSRDGGVNVAEIARQQNGGGHPAAAGFEGAQQLFSADK